MRINEFYDSDCLGFMIIQGRFECILGCFKIHFLKVPSTGAIIALKKVKDFVHRLEKQYQRIAGLLPVQRGNVTIENRVLLNALIYRCENGCKWRALPERFGNWHTVYVRLDRWSGNGVLERMYAALAAEGLIGAEVYSLDATAVKAHPDAHGARKKTARRR